MKKQKIIITGKNYVLILAIARSLKNDNYEIIVLNTSPISKNKIKSFLNFIINGKGIDAASRYIDKYVNIGNDIDEIVCFLLDNYSDEIVKPIIIPVDDYSVSIFDFNYEKLSKYFLLPNIENKQNEINRLLDKNVQKELAIQNHLSVSDGVVLYKENGVYNIPSDLNYPVFTKPEISIKGNKTFMKKCDNREELEALLQSIPAVFDCPIIAERYIHIEKEYAILGYSYNGEVFIPGIIQMIESGKGSQLGVTLLGKTNSIDEYKDLVSNITNLVRETKVNGLFDVDVFESDNKYYFSELNFRFGASGYALTKIGVNLPEMYVSRLLNANIQTSNVVLSKFFVNEKVLLDDFTNGYINYNDYNSIVRKADFGFIVDKEDSKPYHRFLKKLFIKRVKKLFR